MKKLLILSAAVFLLFTSTKAQTTTAFRKNYNQALFDLPGNIVEGLTANTYVMAGTNMTFIPIYGTVTELNDTGAINWSYRFSDASIGFQLNDIKKDAANNQYIVCGGSESNAAVFMVLNSTGAIVMQKKFSIAEANSAWFNRIIKASDGGYVAVGYVTGHDPDGAGAEIDFNPINYTDTNGDPQTEYIGSPLIVKFDASGNHVWHRVFRYYVTSNVPANRIYNDASFVDVVEVSDGYVAVGSYDVNNHLSATNSDGDDATPTDALILKTSTAGAITYHKQIDNPSNSTTQSSKYFGAVNKTAAGDIIAGGTDNSRELIQKFAGAGGFSNTFSRLFTYSSSFVGADPVDISQIYEVNGSTDLVTMAMYIRPLSVAFHNSIHRVNPTATTNVFAKRYNFNLLSILPRGGQTSDNGYISMSMTAGGTNYDYHVIKTDPTGDTPSSGCPATSFTPTAAAGPTTFADPIYNSWSGTPGSDAITVARTAITPTPSYVCTKVACVAPTAPVVGTITQPTCSTTTGSVAFTGLPSSGTWTITASPGGATATGTGTTGSISGLTAGTTYTFTVQTVAGCPSSASGNAIINAAPTVPTAPTIGTITQPSCTVATGSVALSGLPSSGTWTVTGSPSGTATGTGTTTTISGLAPGTYTFTVSNGTCTSTSSLNAVLNTQPTTPTAPVVGAITQPNCTVTTGSVALSGLPSSGTWTIAASPGGATATGTGTTTTFTGLTAGATYTFTVSNGTCTSAASTNAVVNPLVGVPTAPAIGTITQPTCTVATGSVALSGLPASGSWTVTGSPSGTATGSGTTTTISGLAPGSYTFIVNDGTCNSPSSLMAVVNAQPTTPTAPVIGTITQPTCSVATGSVALSGLPSSGTWTITGSPSGTATGTGTTTTISGLAAGTYTFTVSNGTCTSTTSVNAVVNTQPTIPVAPAVGTITQPSCTVATASVALSGLPAGSWTVTITPGGTTVNGSGTTTTVTGLTAGNTYTFTVNDGTCTSTSSTNAVINAQPTTPSTPVLGTVTQPTCTISTGDVALSGLPAGSWTITATPGGTTQTGSGTTATFTGLAGGATYTFTVNDGTCTSAASASVTINTFAGAPTAPLLGTITQPTCAATTASVVLNGLPASGSWTITTTPGGATTTGTGTTTTITGLTPGTTYTFTVDNGTCTSTASANALVNNVPTPPSATAGTPLVLGCSPTSGTISASSTTSGVSYTWAGPGIVSGGATSTATVNAVGTYTVTITDPATSCTATTTVGVTSNIAAPNVSAGGTLTLTCAANSGTISASSTTTGATYNWTGAGITAGGTTATPTVNAAGTYTVTVTDPANGCTATTTVSVSANSTAPNVTAGATTPINCTSGIGTVSANSTTTGATYSWAGPGVVSGGTTATPNVNAAGTYTVTVTDPSNGCTATTIVTAANSPGPIASAGTDVTITGGTSTTLTATGGGTYLWSTGETTSAITVTPTATTDYCVTVTDTAGCSDSACVRVTVDIVCGELFVPNAFSPNGDNYNDKFRVKVNPDCVMEVQLFVYDRWGEKVFEASTADAASVTGWDGTFNGKALDNAVFVWYLNITLTNDPTNQIKQKGNVSLIR
ncbi:MAG: gliding motility-associated C-terminal domain-containing protein [Bacteroidia bacterium]|nr:gliding motility-associated C-terminal domain-containing protein [Bacteroidia bacterium]